MDLTQAYATRQETDTEGAARTRLSHGIGEQYLGCAAHPRRVEDARIRNLRTNRIALNAEDPSSAAPIATMEHIPGQPP
jgi:hypothetical protein